MDAALEHHRSGDRSHLREVEAILQRLRAFSDRLVPLSDAEWSRFIDGMHARKLAPREYFLRSGSICDHIAFIGKGALRMFHERDGEEITIDICLDGSYCTDYVSFLTRQPSTRSIQAIDEVEMVVFDRDHLEHLYATSPMAERMGRRIAEGLFIHLAERTGQFLTESPEQRYVRMLNERPEVVQRIPLRFVASYLGVRPETLSRIRSRWARSRKRAA